MERLEEIIDNSKSYQSVEFEGKMYFCTQEARFEKFDDGLYWWQAPAVDNEGDEYMVYWAFDADSSMADSLPWDDVQSVEPL